MRAFKCFSCNHTWQLPFGTGGPGIGLTCPECGSNNIHRDQRGQGGGRGRRFGRSGVEIPGMRGLGVMGKGRVADAVEGVSTQERMTSHFLF